MFPFPRVSFWVHILDPQPNEGKGMVHRVIATHSLPNAFVRVSKPVAFQGNPKVETDRFNEHCR